jgi:hypothetical protein
VKILQLCVEPALEQTPSRLAATLPEELVAPSALDFQEDLVHPHIGADVIPARNDDLFVQQRDVPRLEPSRRILSRELPTGEQLSHVFHHAGEDRALDGGNRGHVHNLRQLNRPGPSPP